jgi:hypothetical protein
VFASPKSYTLRYFSGCEITKIKGVNASSISFEEFKDSFYNNKKIKPSFQNLIKNNYTISEKNLFKLVNLNNYDKRKFSDDFCTTEPFIFFKGKYS